MIAGIWIWPSAGPTSAARIAEIDLGDQHSCVRTTPEGVWCWGRNQFGQIGVASSDTCKGEPCARTPVGVVGLEGGLQAITAGNEHTCGLTTAGGVKCVGLNNAGGLGDGQACGNTFCTTPVDVCEVFDEINQVCTQTLSNVADVEAGGGHLGGGTFAGWTCALTTADRVKCWGHNEWGQLGDGTLGDGAVSEPFDNLSTTPVDVCQGPPGAQQCNQSLSSVEAVAAGVYHTCALMLDTTVKCWGRNESGQLGDGTTTTRSTPVGVCASGSGAGCSGGSALTGVLALAAGGVNTCAVVAPGSVKCWGGNSQVQLGIGPPDNDPHPNPVDVCADENCSSNLSNATTVTTNNSSCALIQTSGVKCWGDNPWGQVGDGTTNNRTTPVDVCAVGATPPCTPANNNILTGVVSLAQTDDHTCALTQTVAVLCWGSNNFGELGAPPTETCGIPCSTTPLQVVGLKASPIPPKFDALLLKIDGLPGPPGLQTSLSAKLNTAQRLTEGANACASANVLGAFINQVQAQTDVMISAGDASLLLAQAKGIINQLLDGVTCPPDPDTDGDLMTDSAEITLGTNPSNPDTDADIPSDGMELLHTGTDPLDPDTDGDGTPDGGEDPDMDGCTTGAEVQTAPGSEVSGGLRDPLNEWDYFDVNGDRHIDVPNDILPVILAYQQGPLDPGGQGPNYSATKDRGPAIAGALFAWQRTGPDGHIDVVNDLLPIILQYLHSCK